LHPLQDSTGPHSDVIINTHTKQAKKSLSVNNSTLPKLTVGFENKFFTLLAFKTLSTHSH